MQINNPLQINDWEFKKFLKVVLAIQLAVWSVIGLDVIGFQIPIIRQLIGFIYLTFIPGIIILRILKLHKLGNIEMLLYTVGLSIATLMFTGLLMNTVYPLFGISGPISLTPLVITISIIVLVLFVLSYIRDKNFSDPSFIEVKDMLSPPALFLCMVPFLSIFGTYLVNFHHNNILLMLMIVVIALVVLLIGFDKFIPKNLYPVAVFVIALSLLYHTSLISMYLQGWDIHHERFIANLVIINSCWDLTIPYMGNAMLSLAMLAPIFSNICSMCLTWVFKIIYPLLFSLVPIGLYRVFQKQTDDKIAFLACFFFVSCSTFFIDMPELARQEIAELFLVLLILLMIDKDMNKTKRSFLFIVFGISLAVSHYGLSYIYMFCLTSAWLILVSLDHPAIQKLGDNFYSKFSRYRYKREKLALAGNPISLKVKDRTINSTFVLLFITFTLSWYMYVSSSAPFNTIITIGDHIASSISTDFLNPETAQGLDMMLTKPTSGLLHEVNRVINYLNQIFIIIGVIVLLLKHRVLKFGREHATFSMVNLLILFAAISVPFFASSLNMNRVYQITLIFLAPFSVIGGITVFKMISRVLKVSWTDKNVRRSLKVLSVYFVIVLLYQTGFIWEVTEGCSGSTSLSNRDSTCYTETEAIGAQWLAHFSDSSSIIYADTYGRMIVYDHFHIDQRNRQLFEIPSNIRQMREDAYIYLRSWNIEKHEVISFSMSKARIKSKRVNFEEVPGLFNLISIKNKVYDNGESQVFAPRRY